MTKEEILSKIEKAVSVCQKCRLYKTATQPVPGEGNPAAQIAFVGEAPGYNEDREGRPFVGRAGKLLDDLLRGVGLKRSDVWIGNILKHRPPENRDPLIDELRACRPYLRDQIKAIKPKVIAALGRFALSEYLPDAKISEVHGQVFRVSDYLVLPLYHPAAALRSESVLADLRRDFKQIVSVLKKPLEQVPFYRKAGLPSSRDSQLMLFSL